jgi:RNA polymerase sigma factor (sigma-70 family)
MLSDAEAEDAAQAGFILCWQKAMSITEESRMAGWMHRTTQHVCRNAKRSRASRIKHEQKAAAESRTLNQAPVELAQWNEIREILDEEVDRLPEKLRIPFVLFHFENRSLADVADLVGSTVPTVGTWLQRARKRLADRLRRRQITVGATTLAAILSEQFVPEAVPARFVSLGFPRSGWRPARPPWRRWLKREQLADYGNFSGSHRLSSRWQRVSFWSCSGC